MGTDYAHIYQARAEDYQRLVAREDWRGTLAPALGGLVALDGAQVVEVGAGTGRLTRLLLQAGARVLATEPQEAMRAVARRVLAEVDPEERRHRVVAAVGDALPAADASADLAVAGWVFGHLRSWVPDGWRAAVGACLDEMARVTRPGGVVAVIETLGTGVTEPAPPSEALAEYYAVLEEERGFARQVLRTDYRFASPEEAQELLNFFFGPEKAARAAALGGVELPECTGLWWRRR